MIFCLTQRNFEGNLYSTYVVKVFLAGITIFGRRDWTIKLMPEMPLKVQRPLRDVPQAYELKKCWTALFSEAPYLTRSYSATSISFLASRFAGGNWLTSFPSKP